VYNKQITYEATDNIDVTACAVQAADTFCYYLVSANDAFVPTIQVTKGVDGSYNLPETPRGYAAIGALKVTTTGVTFTAGTTALNTVGVVTEYFDLDVGIATKLINQAVKGLERKYNFGGMMVRATHSLAAGTSAAFDNPIPLYKQFVEDGGIYATGIPAVLGLPVTVAGEITSIPITSGGSGYLSAPTITITGDGSSATATTTITNGVITAITITAPGSGYNVALATLSDQKFRKYQINKQDINEVESAFADNQTGSPQLIAVVPQTESSLSPDIQPNEQLLIRPIPDLPYTVVMTAYQYSPPLDGVLSDRNWLVTDHSDVLLFGSLIQAESYLKNDSRIPVWKTIYTEKLAELMASDESETYAGSSRYGQGL
jgi:hypothetical protein